MQRSSPKAQLADHLLNGELAERLRAWRENHESWDSIAKLIWLETDQQVSVTGPAVQAWARRLDLADRQPEPEEQSA